MHAQGRLSTDFRPLPFSVGHHVPCHLKGLGSAPAGPALLALIPQLRAPYNRCELLRDGGHVRSEGGQLFRVLDAGQPMLDALSHPRVLFGSTECSTCPPADGGWAAGKRTLHPAQYLALAYGLLPELYRRLHEPIHDRAIMICSRSPLCSGPGTSLGQMQSDSIIHRRRLRSSLTDAPGERSSRIASAPAKVPGPSKEANANNHYSTRSWIGSWSRRLEFREEPVRQGQVLRRVQCPFASAILPSAGDRCCTPSSQTGRAGEIVHPAWAGRRPETRNSCPPSDRTCPPSRSNSHRLYGRAIGNQCK